MQTTVASTGVAADPRGRAPGGWNTGAWPAGGGGSTRRIAEGATSGGASTSPRRPTGAAEGGEGWAGSCAAGGAGGAAAGAAGAEGGAGGAEGTSMSDGTARGAVT